MYDQDIEGYVPLWCKSNYSFLEGASHPDELIRKCAELGIRSVAITDRDGVYGIVRAHVAAYTYDVKLIIGSEITIDDGSTVVLLAKDKTGYSNLCTCISNGRLRNEKGVCTVRWQEIIKHCEGQIALLSSQSESIPKEILIDLKQSFSKNLYLILPRHYEPIDVVLEQKLKSISNQFNIPIVAATEVLYHEKSRSQLQDVLTCIRNRSVLYEAGNQLKQNNEHGLKSVIEFHHLYHDISQAIHLTQEIAEKCRFNLSEIVYRYPSELLPTGYTTSKWLRVLTRKGTQKRYGNTVPDDVIRQLEKELDLIDELDYCGYFLTMWDIVQFCKKNKILCQGRGSAANSIVCYCLEITSIDPVRMDLLFERFLSRERAEPPDIDLDIEHRRREEVIQHMYEKYGRSHAAMVANVVRYRHRSALREVGKVLGIPPTMLDMLSKLIAYRGGNIETAMGDAGIDVSEKKVSLLVNLSREIRDFPRHLSIHPGGFLLGSEPVMELVPIENATMPDRTVIQWDKYDVEELGLFKVDLLGLGALTHLHFGFDLLKQKLNLDFSMKSIPGGDRKVFDMITGSDTIGVFQLESRAQMSMLPRLAPKNYYDIVIEISIVRPGPIAGGMVHPFLKRRNGEEKITYPHPSLEPVLKKTLGVPLFQEQVMKLAVVAAGYTPGEADQLRRDMAAWRRQGSIERHQKKLIEGMLANDIRKEFAEQVFEQIKGFGEYGFPESHAASFALIAYTTAWLKCHYPVVFACALLNAWPMGFYSPATIVQDSKRHGIEFLQVDVLESGWECTLVPKASLEKAEIQTSRETADACYAIRMGLRFVHGLGEKDFEKIDYARNSPPSSMKEFIEKTGLNKNVLSHLAQSGALNCFGVQRREALWHVLDGYREEDPTTTRVVQTDESSPKLDLLTDVETIFWDHAYAGHSTNGHPLEPFRDQIDELGLPDASTLGGFKNGVNASYAGLVICRQLPDTAKGTLFLTLEDETGFVNCLAWQKTFQQYRTEILTNTFLGVTGKIQAEKGLVYVIIEKAWKPSLTISPERHESRNFR